MRPENVIMSPNQASYTKVTAFPCRLWQLLFHIIKVAGYQINARYCYMTITIYNLILFELNKIVYRQQIINLCVFRLFGVKSEGQEKRDFSPSPAWYTKATMAICRVGKVNFHITNCLATKFTRYTIWWLANFVIHTLRWYFTELLFQLVGNPDVTISWTNVGLMTNVWKQCFVKLEWNYTFSFTKMH